MRFFLHLGHLNVLYSKNTKQQTTWQKLVNIQNTGKIYVIYVMSYAIRSHTKVEITARISQKYDIP